MSTAPRTTTPASTGDSQPARAGAASRPILGRRRRRLAEFGGIELGRERSTAPLTLLPGQFAAQLFGSWWPPADPPDRRGHSIARGRGAGMGSMSACARAVASHDTT